MSVFSLKTRQNNPVTISHLDSLTNTLGVTLPDSEKEEYRTLLAVYHESMEKLMAMDDHVPSVDLNRFPRKNIHFPKPEENPLGAWAWKCEVKDTQYVKGSGGLLEGKTIALKDCIALKDVPFLLGTKFFTDFTPNTDATIVTRILLAGGTITGRAVCENQCHSATSHSASTGVVHNPYAHGYSSGGSSSGSGALVASGAVDMAIGADQGGSIRVPAGWCGIYGLKPTFGLVPFTGCASNEPTNDHVGPMTRTLLDNALLLQAIAGSDNIDDRCTGPSPSSIPAYHSNLLSLPTPLSLSGIKIGILIESLTMPGMDPRILSLFHSSTQKLQALGATLQQISVPFHTHGSTIWTGVSKAGGYLNRTGHAHGRRGLILNDLSSKLHPMQQSQWENAYPATKNIYLNGLYAEQNFPGLIGKATNLSRKLRDAYDAALEEVDVLVLPNVPYVANSHGRRVGDGAGVLESMQKQVGLTGNTACFNQSGHPVLAMPVGMLEIEEGPLKGSGTKLPVSMQVVGRWWGEESVYRVAYAWSERWDWKTL